MYHKTSAVSKPYQDTLAFRLSENMLGYFSMKVIWSEKETVFQGTENYPSILSRQMGVIEIVIPRKYFATRETKRLAKAFRLRLRVRHGMLSFQLVYFSVTPAESSPFLHLSLKEAFWTLGFQLWEYHSTNITGYFPVFLEIHLITNEKKRSRRMVCMK